MLFRDALLVCSASILRRRCVERLAGFDAAIRLMEDADFHVRAIREFGAYFMDGISTHYRIGANSLMHSPSPGASHNPNASVTIKCKEVLETSRHARILRVGVV